MNWPVRRPAWPSTQCLHDFLVSFSRLSACHDRQDRLLHNLVCSVMAFPVTWLPISEKYIIFPSTVLLLPSVLRSLNKQGQLSNVRCLPLSGAYQPGQLTVCLAFKESYITMAPLCHAKPLCFHHGFFAFVVFFRSCRPDVSAPPCSILSPAFIGYFLLLSRELGRTSRQAFWHLQSLSAASAFNVTAGEG